MQWVQCKIRKFVNILISKYETAINSSGKTSPLDIHMASLSITKKNLSSFKQHLWDLRSYNVLEYITGYSTVHLGGIAMFY